MFGWRALTCVMASAPVAKNVNACSKHEPPAGSVTPQPCSAAQCLRLANQPSSAVRCEESKGCDDREGAGGVRWSASARGVGNSKTSVAGSASRPPTAVCSELRSSTMPSESTPGTLDACEDVSDRL